jgi:hypothetical protein
MPGRFRCALLVPLALLLLALSTPRGHAAAPPRSEVVKLDRRTLPRLLAERGFRPPRRFKALVVVVEPRLGVAGAGPRPGADGGDRRETPDDGTGRLRFRPFDWRGTSLDRADWWPASSVKLFAATAALEAAHGMGFTPAARVTFHYDRSTGLARHPDGRDPTRDEPVTLPLERIVRAAITPSDNRAFDRLVEIVGSDPLNRRFLSRRHGLHDTVLLRSYAWRVADPLTGLGSSRHSPPLTFAEEGRTKLLPERHGTGQYPCEQGNCSSLRDLAEVLRRVMLHEELPERERFGLGPAELALLRDALSAPRERGNGVVDGLRAAFGGRPVRLYHKPGYALRWFSDVVFVEAADTGERWIVAMAGYPGRGALDDAARHVGALLADGPLRPPRAVAETAPPPAAVADPGAAGAPPASPLPAP